MKPHPNLQMGTPEFSAKSRETRLENQAVRMELAWAFLRTGTISGAVRAVWSHLDDKQVLFKSQSLAKSHWFQKAIHEAAGDFSKTSDLSPLWCLTLWRDIAIHAKNSAIRLKASELVAKHLGMFIERKEIRSLKMDLSGMTKEKLLELVEIRMKALKGE